MADRLTQQEESEIRLAAARASEQGWGIAMGVIGAVGLWLATVVLVVRGGDNPGPHLGMIAVYFPGYRVTWLGSFVGFIYAFVVGYAVGRTIATVYNRLTSR